MRASSAVVGARAASREAWARRACPHTRADDALVCMWAWADW